MTEEYGRVTYTLNLLPFLVYVITNLLGILTSSRRQQDITQLCMHNSKVYSVENTVHRRKVLTKH